MEKFYPVYSLSVEVDDGSSLPELLTPDRNVVITLPYTIEFSISRASLTSAQWGTFRVYGLGDAVRNAIQKDFFQYTQLRAIQFRAGYDSPNGKFLALAFNGTVNTAYSWRGEKGWVTEIEAYDGGFAMANGFNVNTTISRGHTIGQTLTQLAALLPNQSGKPIIGNLPSTTNSRGEVLFGNVWDLIVQKSDGLAFIDNGQVKILNYSDAIKVANFPVLSSDTGLLGSPKRTTSTLEFDMLFEPRLTVGQLVTVKSTTNPQYNRDWKVMGFEHHGIISETVAGETITSVKLWFSPEDLKLLSAVAPVIQ